MVFKTSRSYLLIAAVLTAFLGVNGPQKTYARTEVKPNGSTVSDENSQQEEGDQETVSPQQEIVPARNPASETAEDPGESSDDAGEAAARKYFRKPTSDSAPAKTVSDSNTKYLWLHAGAFLSADSYQWGATPHTINTGRITAGGTYRMGSISSIMDWSLRADFMGYQFPESAAFQLGIIPMIMIPDTSSKFPLYFGIGAGPGIFFNQVQGQSSLAFDYELVGGVRLLNVLDTTGFFLETGMKNNVLLLSQGQFNGYFIAAGAIFTF